MRLAAQRPLLPALQGMLLRVPLRPRSASARPDLGLHVRLSLVSAYMVRRAVSARVEDHVRGDAKLLGGVDAGDRTAGHGGLGLPLLQHPRIQSEATGRPSPEGGSADRVIRRSQRRLRPLVVPGSRATAAFRCRNFRILLYINTPRCDRADRAMSQSVVL